MKMTDQEFDVLDELYFVQPFSFLTEELEVGDEELKPILQSLLNKGFVKCFFNMNDEVFNDSLDFENEFSNYYYLATKQGLIAHNGR